MLAEGRNGSIGSDNVYIKDKSVDCANRDC